MGNLLYQYDSFSADGNLIAVAWDRGEAARGTYLLNIKSGKRKEVEALNNGKTDIAQYNIDSDEITMLVEHEAWDWLPSNSPDGNYLYFTSYRKPQGIYRIKMSNLIDCEKGSVTSES